MDYELIEGNTVNVLTLSPEELIKEKTLAYNNRRFIRDLYDIYVLITHINHPKMSRGSLINFLNNR